MTWRHDSDDRGYGRRMRGRGRGDFSHTLRRARTYLAGRPAESWAFFAAGFVLALVLF